MLIRRAGKDTIPVIILAGYLGAGKTTILNHILRTAVGARIAVIVNDFGSVNIDSLLITAQSDNKLELTNGCICCSMDGGELEEALDAALSAKPDVVIVEASGLAEPEDLARMVILSPNSMVGYGGLVYLVDAVNFDETLPRHTRMSQHIELADLVVLTKVEQVSKTQTHRLEATLSRMTKVPVVPVASGELAPELIFDIPLRSEVQPSLLQQESGREERHLHEGYRSTTIRTTEPIDHEKFKAFMNDMTSGVYRVKGYVYFGVAGYEQKYIVQSVGGRWDMYVDEWEENETPQTTLVFIGLGYDESELRAKFREVEGEGSTMIDLQRYAAD